MLSAPPQIFIILFVLLFQNKGQEEVERDRLQANGIEYGPKAPESLKRQGRKEHC